MLCEFLGIECYEVVSWVYSRKLLCAWEVFFRTKVIRVSQKLVCAELVSD